MAQDAGAAALRQQLALEAGQGVSPAVEALTAEIVRRHARSVVAVLFYGSCLRLPRAAREDSVYDFYVLVDSYRNAYGGWRGMAANWLLPPNVFYFELSHEGRRLRTKYALISLAQFRRGVSARSFEPMLWARFAQPARIVHARDHGARATVEQALAQAHTTMLRQVARLMGPSFTAVELWVRGFSETYRSELRTEGALERARLIVEADRRRYERLTPLILAAAGLPHRQQDDRFALADVPSRLQARRAALDWRLRRVWGKLLNLLRLAKATFTFAGAVDYVLWKIERHAGIRTTVTPWQRRHPLLASPLLAWRLYRLGAFR
jgi:hypothetical protein